MFILLTYFHLTKSFHPLSSDLPMSLYTISKRKSDAIMEVEKIR